MDFTNFPLPEDKFFLITRYIEVAEMNKNNPRFKFMSAYKQFPTLVKYVFREHVSGEKRDRLNRDFDEIHKMFSIGNYNFKGLKLPNGFKSFFEYLAHNSCYNINEMRLIMVYTMSKLIEEAQRNYLIFLLDTFDTSKDGIVPKNIVS